MLLRLMPFAPAMLGACLLLPATPAVAAEETDPGPFRHAPSATPPAPHEASADPAMPAPGKAAAPAPLGAARWRGPAEDLPLLAHDGACPESATGERTFREFRAELRWAGSREVILPGVVLYADADLALPLKAPPLDFGTDVTVLRWNQSGLDSHLIKRTTDKGARCGWIENAALLPEDRSEPLPIEALRADGIPGFSGVGSTLDAKVLVRNQYDEDDDSTATGAPVYYRYTDPEPYKSLKIFNVLNVFDYVEHGGKVWFFVGGEQATEQGRVKMVPHGWVPAENLIPWSTRVAVYPRPGKNRAQIYENNSQAERGGEGFASVGHENLPEDRNVPRFPLLETVTLGPNTLHRIAFPGTACDSAGNCISAPASAVGRAELGDEMWNAFFKRDQLVREGWVRQDPSDPEWDYWLAAKPDEMVDLVEANDVLCETLSDTSPDFNEVRDAMLATLRGVTGDVPKLTGPADETNIRLFLEKRLHVPKEQFSELLGKDIDGFVDWYRTADPGARNAFSEGICRKSGLLRLAQDGQRVVRGPEDIVFDKRLRTWAPRDGSTRPFNWVWGTEDGILWFYIPLDYVL
jgi:hypothetical protein